jgi:hypothetical protein
MADNMLFVTVPNNADDTALDLTAAATVASSGLGDALIQPVTKIGEDNIFYSKKAVLVLGGYCLYGGALLGTKMTKSNIATGKKGWMGIGG